MIVLTVSKGIVFTIFIFITDKRRYNRETDKDDLML